MYLVSVISTCKFVILCRGMPLILKRFLRISTISDIVGGAHFNPNSEAAHELLKYGCEYDQEEFVIFLISQVRVYAVF